MLRERAESWDGIHASIQTGFLPNSRLDLTRRVVNTYRKVETARLVVHREEIRIAGGAVAAFDTLLEHTAGAMVFRPTHFLHRLIDVEQRQNGHPAQPSAALLRGFGDPTIVGLAKRHVDLR